MPKSPDGATTGRRAFGIGLGTLAVVCVLVAATLLPDNALPTAGTTRLALAVTGLPPGVAAAVTVSGPVTYDVTEHTDDREVPAGAYTLGIRPVETVAGTAYPDLDEEQFTVAPGGATTLAADYVTIIPETTEVLDHTDPGIRAVDGLAVTFAPDSSSVPLLVPGIIFVVAEGPQTPDPLARRVESVTRTDAGVVVETTPVLISEALPAGRFELADPDEIGIRPVAFEPDPLVSIDLGSEIATYQQSHRGRSGSCSGATPRMILALHNPRPRFGHADFGWKAFPPSASVTLDSVGMTPGLSLSSEVSGELDCSLRIAEGFGGIEKKCRSLETQLLRVGPVRLRCKIEPFASVDAGVSVPTSLDFDTILPFEVTDNEPRLDPETRVNEVAQRIAEGSASATQIGAEVGLTIGLQGGDPSGTAWLGLGLEFAMGPQFSVGAGSPAGAIDLGLRFDVNAEMELDLRFESWERSRRLLGFERNVELWRGDTEDLPTTNTTDPTPTSPTHALPHEDDGEVSIGPVAWDLLPLQCSTDQTITGDDRRSAMRDVRYRSPGVEEHWQIATYPDTATATAALAGMRERTGCTGQVGEAVDVPAGDGGFTRNYYQGGPAGDGVAAHWVVVRVDTALLLLVMRVDPAVRADLRVPDPRAVQLIDDAVDTLCGGPTC